MERQLNQFFFRYHLIAKYYITLGMPQSVATSERQPFSQIRFLFFFVVQTLVMKHGFSHFVILQDLSDEPLRVQRPTLTYTPKYSFHRKQLSHQEPVSTLSVFIGACLEHCFIAVINSSLWSAA